MTRYLKALYGAVAAGLGAVQLAYQSDGRIGWADSIGIAIAVVGTFGAVWGVPNYDPKP